MFEEIAENPLIIEIQGKEEELPYPYALDTSEQIWIMAEWLYEEFFRDCESMPAFDIKVGIPIEMDEFKMRSTSRTISYVIHIMNIEGILRRCLKVIKIKVLIGKSLMSYLDSEETERIKEVEILENFRNKVGAHTSYSNPYNEDTEADLEASLGCWAGSWGLTGRNYLNFHIGGLLPVVNGQGASSKYYQISMHFEREKMIPHFKKWKEMFLRIIEECGDVKNQPTNEK